MATMQDIERETREFAAAKRELDATMSALNADTEALKKKYLSRLRQNMSAVAAKHDDLYRMIADNSILFQKPRTQLIDGIRVGFTIGKGKLEIEDPELTVKLIKRYLAEQKDILIKTTEEPAVAAIKKLTPGEQAKIGTVITGKDNKVVIEETDTQLNKILSSLLKFQVEELSEEYSAGD